MVNTLAKKITLHLVFIPRLFLQLMREKVFSNSHKMVYTLSTFCSRLQMCNLSGQHETLF